MKTFAPVLLAALATLASAQLSNLPQCSLQCFLTALGADGCELTDFKCHCEKSDALLGSVQPCVEKACSASDYADVISGVEKTCADAGVSIEVPSPSSTESSSTAAPSSTEAPESTSAAATSSAAASSSSAAAEISSVVSSVVSSLSSVSAAPTASGNGTKPTGAPAPTTSDFPGAASRIGAAAGVVGAAALAVFAL